MDSRRWASTLVDEAMVAAMVPWACPCDFGPNGRFRLEELLSLGRRSLVYKGVDRHLSSEGFQAPVVVKIAAQPNLGIAEALSARRVSHPNVVRVLDLGTDPGSGASYVVTEYIDGGDLSELAVPCSPRRAAQLVAQLARGVQAAHSAGVVHCDLKPANVLLTREGTPKVADFDLCRSPASTDTSARGNAAFMSPEQILGGEIGLAPLSDIYALGGMLRWLLTGQTEVSGDATVRGSGLGLIDPDLRRICDRAMNHDRGLRHSSAAELAEDLEDWLASRPISWTKPTLTRQCWLWLRRHPGRAGVMAAAALLMTGGLTLWRSQVVFEARQREAMWAAREAQQIEAVRLADARTNQVRKQAGALASSLYMILNVSDSQPADELFTQLVIWSELANARLIDGSRQSTLAEGRVMMLRQFLDGHESPAKPETTATIFARYSLAQLLIAGGTSEAAVPELEVVSAWARSRIEDNDPLALGLRVLVAAASLDTLGAASAERSARALSDLQEAVAAAERSRDCGVVCEVGRQVIRRHRGGRTGQLALPAGSVADVVSERR